MDDILEYLSNKLGDIDYKKLIFPTIMFLLYIGGFVYLFTIINHKEEKSTIKEEIKEDIIEDIFIDIKGSVAEPGVYKLSSDSRVIDSIKASGGLKEDANTRFLNLSKQLEDGDVVVVYSNSEIEAAKKENIIYVETPCVCEEVKNDACYKEESNTAASGKVNINTASESELTTLTGIGSSKAKAFIDYRTNN